MVTSKANHYILARILLGLLMMAAVDFTDAQTGVCYGRNGGGLPSPAQVVALYNRNNIRRMRIYDPDQPTLRALAGSNIELMLGVPNTDLPSLASSQANANTWVQNNIRNHPNVRFRYICVGNEVSPLTGTAEYVNILLPALQNIYNAISAAGIGNQIRVSTAIETGFFGNMYPLADGVFRSNVTSFVDPIIRFLVNTGAPLFVNLYPYFVYTGDEQIDLQYALFNSEGIVLPDGTRYQNLFYVTLDAAYAAVEKRGGAGLEIVVSESGWPSAGDNAATLDNARTYNTNLIQRVRSGTPRRPGEIETYVFAMFDEDLKSSEIQMNFGLFHPNAQPKYPISLIFQNISLSCQNPNLSFENINLSF